MISHTRTLLGFVLIPLVMLTACGRSDGGEESATSTAEEVLMIVTLTPVPSATTRSEMVDYVVAEGDTLSGIADEFGVNPQDIVEANNLLNPDSIFVGQTLQIPAPAAGAPES